MDDTREPDPPEELSRSDMRTIRGAVRQDWPIPPDVQAKILKRLVAYLDVETEKGASAPDRTVLMAGRTVAAIAALALKQQQIDLQRDRLEGRGRTEESLADLVAEAEIRAEERIRDRGGEGVG